MSNLIISKASNYYADIHISGSKSYANRALILSAIANGISTIKNLPECDDVKYLLLALENLGIKIIFHNDNIEIHGNNGSFENIIQHEIFCKLAGTTSRFIAALSAITKNQILITGEGRLLERPIKLLCDSLISLGCKIDYIKNNNCLPIIVNSEKLNGSNKIQISGNTSSQFISSLLLIGTKLPNGIEIQIIEDQVSKPYIDITLSLMKYFDIDFTRDNYSKYTIKNQNYLGKDVFIEGDWSSASYFLALSLLLNCNIKLSGVGVDSIQGDRKILGVFKEMGLIYNVENDHILLKGGSILPISINMEDMPDSAMTVIIACSFCNGISKISGLSTLKNKETDRLLALHNELKKCGILTEISTDNIIIYGNPDIAINEVVKIDTYHDHRIAMCMAVFASKTGNIAIQDSGVVSKSMPEFWDLFSKISNIRNYEL